jgi:hypothetical protein
MHGYRALAVLVAYLIVYPVFSINGGYALVQSGKIRYKFGLSVSDLFEHMPYAMWYHERLTIKGKWVTDRDLGGWIFGPLIRLDRRYWHKTIFLFPDKS